MDFRDRQEIKRLTFRINSLKQLPTTLYPNVDFKRMNDEISKNIPLEGIVVLPFTNNKETYFVVVAKSYPEAWPEFCRALTIQCHAWIAAVKKSKSASFNIDALIRKVNAFKEHIEKEENVTLEDFHYDFA